MPNQYQELYERNRIRVMVRNHRPEIVNLAAHLIASGKYTSHTAILRAISSFKEAQEALDKWQERHETNQSGQ